MGYNDHFETLAESGSIATQKTSKKGCIFPLSDAACIADL